MHLKVDDCELEIENGAFVCYSDGRQSHFCEWDLMDPRLQNAFIIIRRVLAGALDTFQFSPTRSAFIELAETYGEQDANAAEAS